MATTGKPNGSLCVIAVGGTVIAFLTSNSISFEMATRDATTKDSGGNTEILEALKSFSVTGEGYFAENASYGFEDLYAVYDARTAVTVRYSTLVSGDMYYEGSMYITSLQKTDGLEETSTFSVTLSGTGAVDSQAVPA
jgi:predicted secreted protein